MKKILFLVLCSALIAVIAPGAEAGSGHAWGQERVRYSAAMTPIHQFRTDLDRGGGYEMSGVHLHSSVTKPVGEKIDVGFSLGYAYEDFRFKNPAFTGGVLPWSEVHTIQGSLVYSRALDNHWRILFSPSLRFAGESGAKSSDALAWGGILSLSRQINPRLVLGAGIAFFDDIEKRSVFPILTVRWDITDHVTLGNAPRTGPAGPSGLELSYRISDGWAMGVGAAWRSKRFRLDKHGFAPGGVGQTRCLPAWVRLSRSLSGGFALDLYGGALFSGDLRVDDAHGTRITATDHSTATFISGTLSARF